MWFHLRMSRPLFAGHMLTGLMAGSRLMKMEKNLYRIAMGAYHLTENFGNSGWKVNGKVTLSEIRTEN